MSVRRVFGPEALGKVECGGKGDAGPHGARDVDATVEEAGGRGRLVW